MNGRGNRLRHPTSAGPRTSGLADVSNLLNDYFASVFTHEPHGYVPSMDSRTNKVMFYEAIKYKDIESLLKNMDGNKALSPDGNHPCFVKELEEFIS